MLRTVLFDMGNVLLFFSHPRMCAQMGAVSGLAPAAVQRLLIDSGLQWDFERGRISAAELHSRWQSLTGRKVSADDLARAASDIFELNTELLPVLDGLRREGLRLVLLSNTCSSHFEFAQRNFSVLDRFDECVVSFRAGAIKPEKPIYEAALQAIRCQPSECLYTDDIPQYIAAGREHGLRGHVFTGVAPLRAELKALGLDV